MTRRWHCLLVLLALIAAGVTNSAVAEESAAAPPGATVPPPAYPRSTVPAAGKKIHFKKTQLDTKFRGEGVAIGDFNHDGKLDIAVGSVYYAAPDWKMHLIADKAADVDPHGYSECFMCFADDLNHDGWTDLIVVSFPGRSTSWFENPKGAAGPWKKHLIAPVSNNESPGYFDIDGNGHRALVMGVAPDEAHCDGPDRQMAILRPDKDPYEPWIIQPISTKGGPCCMRFSHGLGVGSIRNNGRNDVVVKDGWWEAPADKNDTGPWKFHPAKFGPDCSDIQVFDFNGDGRNDVLTSSAHQYGIWWHEQLVDGSWKTHETDKSFSETHSLVLCDIAGDGLPGFVTGKRWWAHGPSGDPGAGDPAVLYWYELVRKNGGAEFVRHEIDDHSGVGTQFEVGDINGDGLLDIVIANKSGVYLFEQQRD